MKNKNTRGDRKIKFTNNNAPMSQSNYGELNYFQKAKNILTGVQHMQRERSGTMHAADMNMIQSPTSFDENQVGFPDIEKDLNLESLSNGDLSRIDGNSTMQRSFTHLNQYSRPLMQMAHPQNMAINQQRGLPEDANILRKTTSENGFQKLANQDQRDLGVDLNDQLQDAETFKSKGDGFYQQKKYEQAFKVYEIARDLIKDYCSDYEEMLTNNNEELFRVNQLRLTVLLALIESAFQLGWYEEAIFFAQEGIDTNSNIARLHHMLAKSILGLSDTLQADKQRVQNSDYIRKNLEHALHSLMKAKDLQPNNMAIRHDLDYVTSIYQVYQTNTNTTQAAQNPQKQGVGETMVDDSQLIGMLNDTKTAKDAATSGGQATIPQGNGDATTIMDMSKFLNPDNALI